VGVDDGDAVGEPVGEELDNIVGVFVGLAVAPHSSIGSQGITISYAQVPTVGVAQEFGDN
jgi:hypothetical protein